MATVNFVYALGRIEPRFPRVSVEKEFAQATGRSDTAGLTDREALHKVLSQPQNRYLVKQLCWILTIEGLETYLVMPRDPADLNALVDALRLHGSSYGPGLSIRRKYLYINERHRRAARGGALQGGLFEAVIAVVADDHVIEHVYAE